MMSAVLWKVFVQPSYCDCKGHTSTLIYMLSVKKMKLNDAMSNKESKGQQDFVDSCKQRVKFSNVWEILSM